MGDSHSGQGRFEHEYFSILDGPISDDVFFELMKNPRCRFVFQYLLDEKDTTLETLSKEMASYEHGCSTDEVPKDSQKSAYVALYQTVLPRMDDVDLIDYSPDHGVVCLAENSVAMKEELNRSDII